MNKHDAFYFFAAGVLIGGSTMFFVGQVRVKKARAQAEVDIRSVKKQYMILHKGGDYSTPESTVEKLYGDRVAELGYTPEGFPEVTVIADNKALDEAELEPNEMDDHTKETQDLEELFAQGETVDEEEETKSIWTNSPEAEERNQRFHNLRALNPEQENVPLLDSRGAGDVPFVISLDEFMEDEPALDKITLTYFLEDDTLMDEREQIIPDILGTVGEECLTQFGEQSKDANVVYVRNARIRADFEIVRDERAYTEVVLGIVPDEPSPRKFREGD